MLDLSQIHSATVWLAETRAHIMRSYASTVVLGPRWVSTFVVIHMHVPKRPAARCGALVLVLLLRCMHPQAVWHAAAVAAVDGEIEYGM